MLLLNRWLFPAQLLMFKGLASPSWRFMTRESALSPRNTAEFNARTARFAVSRVREKRTRRWYESFSEEVPFA